MCAFWTSLVIENAPPSDKQREGVHSHYELSKFI